MITLVNALTIAGSDTISGSGIQGDLKTFSALGIYGTTVITAITAQNTRCITDVYPLDGWIINRQISSVCNDIKLNSIKIGMVYNTEIINQIYRSIDEEKAPIIIDPIFFSTTNTRLLLESALYDFKKKLIPLATVITPNIPEAEQICEMEIGNSEEQKIAAEKIKKMGAKNVIIKGGHSRNNKVIDILLTEEDHFFEIINQKYSLEDTHGSGCNFSAALTSFIAKGISIKNAFILTNKITKEIFKQAMKVGKGISVINPLSITYENSSKFETLTDLYNAVEKLKELDNIGKIIPETQSNFAYALPLATQLLDVAGIEGRLIKLEDKVKTVSSVKFGVSKHVARAIIEYMKHNITIRSAINIRFSDEIVDVLKSKYSISSYDRTKEPVEIKMKEGMTIGWGISTALNDIEDAKVIYHKGDFGKEPMVLLFGSNPKEVVCMIEFLLKSLY